MKNMVRIYWRLEESCYTFIFYLHEFLVVSGSHAPVKGGNKKKSGKISVPNIFMNSYHYNSTNKPYRKPELDLWDKYLKSFLISKRTLLRWINRLIKEDGYMYIGELKELRNKIKDKQL